MDAIVVGASAGGIDAVRRLLSRLSAGSRAAVLVVIHIPENHRSFLSEVLRAGCALPIREAQDKEPIRGGEVVVAPPGYHLLVASATECALSIDPPVLFSRPAIDVLFVSAADVFGDRLAGVVLTGSSADGARGLAAIGAAGGVTLVQDPSTAEAARMPLAAIAAWRPDEVGPIERLGDRLAQLAGEGT
ncbi:MAG: chemotaxis protein CheB [Myxococcota bacterium]